MGLKIDYNEHQDHTGHAFRNQIAAVQEVLLAAFPFTCVLGQALTRQVLIFAAATVIVTIFCSHS